MAEQKGKPKIAKSMLYGIMLGMLLTGTCNTMVLKFQDSTVSECNYFYHPYVQGMFMFVGEFICFGLLFIKHLIYGDPNKKKESGEPEVPLSPGMQMAVEKKKLTKIHPLWLAIPATCDFTASTLMFVALTMVPPSVYQMMRGIIVVITALLSVVFLKRKLYRHHWTSIVFIVLGVAEVGYVAIRRGTEGNTAGSVGMGICLLLVSQCFTGAQFIIEEILLGDYYLDPLVIVGTEGMWGLSYYLLALIPM